MCHLSNLVKMLRCVCFFCSRSLVTHHAVLGIDPQGTIWTNSTSPTDDPLVIAARLLQLIDKSTRPLSERVRDLASMHPILSGDEDAF